MKTDGGCKNMERSTKVEPNRKAVSPIRLAAMSSSRRLVFFVAPLALCAGLLASCIPQHESIDRLLRSYARIPLQYDRTVLSERDRAALHKLWLAARPIEHIFWKQIFPDAQSVRAQLEQSTLPENKRKLEYFLINYGPYDRIRNNDNFLAGGQRPLGAAFYPGDLSSIEFESFLVRHPALKRQLQSPTTLIQRVEKGFIAVPYQEAYAAELSESASLLNQAALLSGRQQFARYLHERAQALVQGDYRNSDRLWVSLRNQPLDIVIGPIEVSEDQLLGMKAAYEAAVLLRDHGANQDLDKFALWADQFLPVAGFHRISGPNETTEAWQVVLFTGQLDAGVKTVAITLPNDDGVRRELGTRKLIFSNVLRAKFERVLRPLAEKLLDPADARDVTEAALFQHALLHESCHAFQGGDNLKPLADTLPILDELKADLLAFHVASQATRESLMSPPEWRRFQISYLAGVLRGVRLGIGTVHAQANAIQLETLLAGKAIQLEKGIFRLRIERLSASIQPLLDSIREIERRADYAAAKRLLQEKARVPSNIQRKLIALDSVPVDVAFDYQSP